MSIYNKDTQAYTNIKDDCNMHLYEYTDQTRSINDFHITN